MGVKTKSKPFITVIVCEWCALLFCFIYRFISNRWYHDWTVIVPSEMFTCSVHAKIINSRSKNTKKRSRAPIADKNKLSDELVADKQKESLKMRLNKTTTTTDDDDDNIIYHSLFDNFCIQRSNDFLIESTRATPSKRKLHVRCLCKFQEPGFTPWKR